jgi:NADH:ubiquinone oxidoreductase subunit E
MKKKDVRVCSGRSCKAFGAERIMNKIEKETGLQPGEENDTLHLDYCGCLGYCQTSPNILINNDHYIFDAEEETVMQEIDAGGVHHPGVEINIDSGDTIFLSE